MGKVVVIDGLARSGTTLLTALLNSQEKLVAFRGIFHELLATNRHRGRNWANYYSRLPMIPPDSCSFYGGGFLNWFEYSFKFKDRWWVRWDLLKNNSVGTLQIRNQFGRLSKDEWNELLNRKINDFDELDEFYQDILLKLGTEVVFFRWNQGLPYLYKWQRNPNHYFISVIRNPLDRACSSLKSHKVSFEESLLNSINYYTLLSKLVDVNQPKFCVLYYEDLVKDPIDQTKVLLQKLGITLSRINVTKLINSDGKPYLVEGSNLVDKYGTHKVGGPFKGFSQESIGKFRVEMPSPYQEEYIRNLKSIPVLSRYFI